MALEFQQRKAREIAELDKFVPLRWWTGSVSDSPLCRELLDGLRSVGFKLTDGIHGTGFGLLAWNKAGGYYLGMEDLI